MGGIEAEGRHIAEGAEHLIVVGGAERLAGVLDDIELVFAGEGHQRPHIDRVAQEMDRKDGPRAFGKRRLQLGHVQIICPHLGIHEDRY